MYNKIKYHLQYLLFYKHPFHLSIIHLFNWSALIDEDKDLGQVTKIIKILILIFFLVKDPTLIPMIGSASS